MSILFAAGELSGLLALDNNTTESTNLSYYDVAYARGSVLSTLGSTSVATTTNFGAQTTIWCHWRHAVNLISANPVVRFYTTGGVEVVRVVNAGGDTRLDYWNGTIWITLTTIAVNTSTPQTFDFRIDAGTRFRFYIAGTLRYDSTPGVYFTPDIGRVAFGANAAASTANVSEVIITNAEPTIGWRLFTRYPTGIGTNSDWTGSFADIDEFPLSDADYISSGTANQVETVTCNPLTIVNFAVRGVVVAARAKCDVTGPQNLQLAIRTNGSNYFSSSNLLDVSYSSYINVWQVNPNTGLDWTTTDAGAFEAGVRSIA